MDWMIVKHSWNKKPIGALGFVDDKIVVVSTFYADKDANYDGKVDWKERFGSFFGLDGKALAEVLNHAYADPDILLRDPSLRVMRGQATVNFAAGMIEEAVYKVYFSRAVGAAAGAAAGTITSNPFAKYFIKKGMKKVVEDAYKNSVRI